MAALDNQWDTDPYGDPTQQAGNPWMTPSTGDPGTAAAATPTPAPSTPVDATGVTPWSEQNPWETPSPAPQAAPQTSAAAPDAYDAHLSTIASATNPAQQATAQDGLARQVQSDLEADGHTVKWTDPTTLSVDGRPYELGASGQGITDPSMASPPPAGAGPIPTNPDGSQVGAGIPWDPKTGAPASNPPGYHWDKNLAMFQPGDAPGTTTTTTGGDLTDPSTWMSLVGDSGRLTQWVQGILGAGADPNLVSYYVGKIQGQPGANATEQAGSAAYWTGKMLGGGGAPPPGSGPTSPWLTTTTTPGPKSLADYPAWSPSAPTYTPDFIDTSASELPGYQDILDTLNTPAPGDEELGKLVQSIVAHPETLSDQDIEMLKAKSAEEAAVAGQSQDEELQHFGYNAGLDSSPWLAGQRAQNAWDRSNTTINANRSIDIAAASQRTADREQAAQIGTAYSSFQSSKKAQAVGLAVNAALGKAGEQRSRTQLNESLKQAATQLGLTKDNLVMTYLGHVMTDLTNNKQLDLNFDIDMKKLAEQSDEFKQTLLQRMAELSQSDNQFKANYQLEAEKFQHQKDQDAWERAKSTVGA